MDNEEIEDLVSQVDDHIAQGYGTKLQLRQKKADEAYRYSLYRKGLQKSNAFNNMVTGVGNRFPNDSVYDKGISVYDLDRGINTYRDEQQSDLAAVGNIALHGAVAAGTSLALGNIYGLSAYAIAAAGQAIANAVDDKDDSPIAWLTDNAFTKILGGANDLITEYTPAYTADSDKEGMSSMMGFNGLDALSTGIGFLAGGQAAAKGIAKMTGEGSKFYELINKAMGGKGLGATAEGMAVSGVTAAEDAAKIAKAKKFTEGVSGLSGTIVGRLGESILERYGTKQEMLQNGYSEEEANRAADMDFLGNMALSSLDYIQNIKMLGTFDKIFPKMAAPAGRYGTKATEYFNEGLKRVGKYDKAKDILSAFGTNAFLEGSEEGLQYAFNKGSQDTVAEGGDWLDFVANTGNELGKSFTTTEGQMSWILGGLLGGGMTAIHTGATYNTPKELNQIWKDYNDLKTDLDTNYKVNENGLYTEYDLGAGKTKKVINQDYIDTINNNSQLESIKEYAKGKNDESLYNAAKNKQVLNQALFNLSIGKYDTFKSQLENTDMTLDEFKAIKAVQENKKLDEVEVTPEDLIKYKKETAEAAKLADEFKQSYETALNLPGFQNLSKESMMRFGSILASQKAVDAELKKIKPELIPALEEYSKQNTAIAFPEEGKKTTEGKPDMRAKKNKEAVENNALATMLNSLENDPIKQAELKDQYEKYKELNVVNKKLLQQYKDILKNPNNLEQTVQKEELEKFKEKIESSSKNYKKLEDIHIKLQTNRDKNFTVQVTDPDGNVKEYVTRSDEGILKLVNAETGKELDVDNLGDNYVIKESINSPSAFIQPEEEEEYSDDGRESINNFQEYDAKKLNFFSSTGSIWRFLANGEHSITNEGEFELNTENAPLSKYMANPKNTPNKENVYSWQLSIAEGEQISPERIKAILEEINPRRLADKTKLLKPLTPDDLLKNDAYRLVKMKLYRNGSPATQDGKEIVCFMHDVDYFYKTAEYDRLFKNDKQTPDQNAADIELAKNRILKERARIINLITTTKAVYYAPVVSKSGGVLSRLPYRNGKRPKKNIIGRVVKDLKSLIEHKSLVPDENGVMKLKSGIGYIEKVDETTEKKILTIKYLNNYSSKTHVVDKNSHYKKGDLVFNDVKANGEEVVNTPFVKGKLSEDEMNGLIDALTYYAIQGKNTIKIGDNEYNLFSSRYFTEIPKKDEAGNDIESPHGILDAIIPIYSNEKVPKKSINVRYDVDSQKFKLILGGKTLNLEGNVRGQIERFFTDVFPKGIVYSVKLDAIKDFKNKKFAFPTKVEENGNAEGIEADSYLNFMFDGEDPRIGTDVSKDFKYVSSYMTFAQEGDKVVLLSSPPNKGEFVAKAQPVTKTEVKPEPKPQPQPQPKTENVSTEPVKSTKLSEKEAVNTLLTEGLNGKSTTFDKLNNEQKYVFLILLKGLPNSDNAINYYMSIQNFESLQKHITKEYGITDFKTSLFGQLSANPKNYNKFIEKLNVIEREPMKTVEEIQEDTCKNTEAPTSANDTTVEVKKFEEFNDAEWGDF